MDSKDEIPAQEITMKKVGTSHRVLSAEDIHKQLEVGEPPSTSPGNDEDRAGVSPQQGENTTRANRQDTEELERVPSGPPHSIFSKHLKQYIVFLAAWGGFFSPLSANIYFPALNTLARELNVSIGVINLTITSYLVFQGLAPTFFGDLGDMLGRRPAYIACFIIYIGANIGLALQRNYAALLVLRCMQSTGSSGTIALGNGVVADIASSGERGKYIGYVVLGPMAGPAIAPIIGGILSQFLGWRAIFWFLTIMGVVYLVPFCISFPETGRNIVGNGSIAPPKWNMSLLNYLASRGERSSALNRTTSQDEKRKARAELAGKRTLRWPNPMKTLRIIAEKDVAIILIYNSLVYTAFYDVLATFPSLFEEIYGYNDLQIGLCFIPYGVGCSIASVVGGYLMDFNYRRVAKQAGFKTDIKRGDDLRNFPIEKARIQVILPPLFVGIAAVLCYGWVLEQNAHLAAPLILQLIMGLTLTQSFNVLSTMLVDLYPLSPATATAANNLVRCWLGAAGTAVVNPMIDGMGRGWCFTFLAAVVLFCSPLLWVEVKWGPKWREERRLRIEKRREREKAAAEMAEETSEEKT